MANNNLCNFFSNTDDELNFQLVLNGKIRQDILSQLKFSSDFVRIFLSSTFAGKYKSTNTKNKNVYHQTNFHK